MQIKVKKCRIIHGYTRKINMRASGLIVFAQASILYAMHMICLHPTLYINLMYTLHIPKYCEVQHSERHHYSHTTRRHKRLYICIII